MAARPILCALLLAPLSAAAAPPAMPCGSLHELAKALLDNAGEEPVTEALGADGQLWITFVAEGGRTWTLVTVDAQGRACAQMIGRGFGVTRAKAEGDPA